MTMQAAWRTVIRLFGALACAAGSGCAGPPNGSGGPVRGLEGVISSVSPGPAATWVTVEPAAGGRGRFVLLVSPGTEILVERTGGGSARGSAASLVVGARIQAEHTGAERRSLPPQYRATRIRVLPNP